MSKKIKSKKNYIQVITIILMVITILSIILWGVVYSVNYAVIGEDEQIDENGKIVDANSSSKKKIINALVCGKNE